MSTELPHTIPIAALFDLIRGLGIDVSPGDTRSITITPMRVEVVTVRRDEQGRLVAVGSDVGTVTTTIRVQR